MQPGFLLTYLEAFHRIQGWFSFDAALMFMAYNQLLARRGITGDVLEIGVHHGLSTIAVAGLRGRDRRLIAIDLFEELQSKNISRSGDGNRTIFERNMRAAFGNTDFIHMISRPSAEIRPRDLGRRRFSFCHIDGGHSRAETYDDLKLCHDVLLPGGILVLDDYFNVEWPGVCEGALEFKRRHRKALVPVAIGFGKVLFQKTPISFNLSREFQERFPEVAFKTVQLWDCPTPLFTSSLRSYFDLQASSPERFCSLGSKRRAEFTPRDSKIEMPPGGAARVAVQIANTSTEEFPFGEKVFGLSYHLLAKDGSTLRHDNHRSYLSAPLAPGESTECEIEVLAPPEAGDYLLEFDLVWEGVLWFRDIGNPTASAELVVR